MKFLYDLFPGLLFLATLILYDIYAATTVGIAAAFIQVGWHWARTREFENLHLITLAAFVIFGGLTLWLRDDTFIKWKPTIVYWVIATLLIGSQFIGEKTFFERMLGKQLSMPAVAWKWHNFSFGMFMFVLSLLNLYVAFYFRLDLDEATRLKIWGYFKVFGTMILTFVFLMVQSLFMAKYMQEAKELNSSQKDES